MKAKKTMDDYFLIHPKNIICADDKNTILTDHVIEINQNKIISLKRVDDKSLQKNKGRVLSFPNLTLIPGFVQTHVHTCQTLFRGMAENLPLLDWLKNKIFPLENAHNQNSLRASVRLGIHELTLSGSTTILDMGTLNYQNVIFDEMINSGIRGFSGKSLIDVNELFTQFKSDTNSELKQANDLAENYHKINDRIKYGFAPRFVLSCSEELLKESHEMMKNFPGSVYHSHSSENKDESAEVKKKFNLDNIEYFNSLNLLNNHTILAHCVHTSTNEINILKETNARVSHCPSANLKLGSGIAPIPEFIKKGISVSLGADGAACNNNLSMLTEMRLASLIQKPVHGTNAMDAKTVFRLATIEGAKALHLENEIGSIEVGKKADLVLIDLESTNHSLTVEKDFYSDIVYSSTPQNIKYVMIDGKWVVENGKSLIYDNEELIITGKAELNKLLKRL